MRSLRWLCGVAACLQASAVVGAAAETQAEAEHYVLRVHVADKERQVPILASLQLDLAGIDVKASAVDFVGDLETYGRLRAAGFDPEIVWSSAGFAPEALGDYLNSTEVSQRLDVYQTTYPGLARKIQIATTENGRPEWALKISDNVDLDEDEPVVLYVGQHHAREVMTPEITMDIIDTLLTRYATDSQVRAWVDGREIWVVVSHNPDGADYVFSNNNNWRKNRRNNGNGTFGVDPNRNYPFNWGACGGSSGTTSSDTYRGPVVASEPETQGFMQLARDVRPALALSYHTYSELVIMPYGCAGTYTSENRMFRDFSSDVGVRVPNDAGNGTYQPGTGWELLYAVDGEWGDWLYGELGTAAITIEANHPSQGFQPDYGSWRATTVSRNRPGWQFLLDRVDGPAITGHTTNACTGTPLSATLALDEIVFSQGETPRASEPAFGRFDWVTSPGLWHLDVSKPGFRTQNWPIDVGLRAARREVRLVPDGSFAVEVLSRSIDDAAGDGDGEVDPGETVGMPVTAYATGGAVSGVAGVLSTADPYVTITDAVATWPAIAAGGAEASTDDFAFHLGSDAPDGHIITFTLTFSAAEPLCSLGSTFDVRVTTGSTSCPAASETLDANPGWTIQNSNSLGWAFGGPGPPSGQRSGPPAAHTGANVFGTNLNGAYGNGADYKLVTTPFDLRDLTNTELRFWRWLNNEEGYDLAAVDVSTDGVAFTTVWSGYGYDTQWEPYRIDISGVADGKPRVYVRFRLESDSSVAWSGFYLDDVSICGETQPPGPNLVVASWSFDDAQNPPCGDHDAYADPGEIGALTVHVRNDGSAAADSAVAILSTTHPGIALIDFSEPLGTLAADATSVATFRFRVADAAGCGETAPFRIDIGADAGAYAATDSSIALVLNADEGAPVPDSFDNFESAAGWALTGEWEIGQPLGRGGSTSPGGVGGSDPLAAVSGMKVLGVDLRGQGASLGNYENNLAGGITATSPVYDCLNAQDVQLQFKRWLGVQASSSDQAVLEAWDGAAWNVVWANPNANLSETSWQSVSYDVSPWAAGNPGFRVRFKLTTNASQVYCGWNIDDLLVTNGHVPRACEGVVCAVGCTPSQEVVGVTVQKVGGVAIVVWTDGTDPCLDNEGARYRVYRTEDPRPTVVPPTQWPQHSSFADVTARDADGIASNASYTDGNVPAPGQVLYYVVVPMGSSGAEGPKGWLGL